jgi:hypothetical protein
MFAVTESCMTKIFRDRGLLIFVIFADSKGLKYSKLNAQ